MDQSDNIFDGYAYITIYLQPARPTRTMNHFNQLSERRSVIGLAKARHEGDVRHQPMVCGIRQRTPQLQPIGDPIKPRPLLFVRPIQIAS